MQEKQLTIKGLSVNYKIFGSGKPLLVLHGWGSGSEKWQHVGGLLGANGFLVIVPDLPGFGKSEAPKGTWNLDSYVEWVHEFCNAMPELADSFVLLGHSFGGAVASKFTIKYNQKVTKLFLVSASCVREKTIKKKALEKLSKLFKIFSLLPFYHLIRKAFYKYVVGGYDYVNAQGSMKDTFLRIVSEDISDILSFIRVPTVIIWGVLDPVTPLRQGKIIHKNIENSKLITVDGAKHALQISAPEVLVEKIIQEL